MLFNSVSLEETPGPRMSDSEDSDFSDNQSEQSSEAEEVDKNEAEVS